MSKGVPPLTMRPQCAVGGNVGQPRRTLHGNGMYGGQAERFQFADEGVFGTKRRVDRFDMVAAFVQPTAEIEKVTA